MLSSFYARTVSHAETVAGAVQAGDHALGGAERGNESQRGKRHPDARSPFGSIAPNRRVTASLPRDSPTIRLAT